MGCKILQFLMNFYLQMKKNLLFLIIKEIVKLKNLIKTILRCFVSKSFMFKELGVLLCTVSLFHSQGFLSLYLKCSPL